MSGSGTVPPQDIALPEGSGSQAQARAAGPSLGGQHKGFYSPERDLRLLSKTNQKLTKGINILFSKALHPTRSQCTVHSSRT